MQSFRKNFLIIAGLLVMAASVSAFIAKPATTMYWYNVSTDGQTVVSYIGTTAPSCNEPSGDYCALGFLEEDIQNPESSSPILTETAESDPLSYKDAERHKQ